MVRTIVIWERRYGNRIGNWCRAFSERLESIEDLFAATGPFDPAPRHAESVDHESLVVWMLKTQESREWVDAEMQSEWRPI